MLNRLHRDLPYTRAPHSRVGKALSCQQAELYQNGSLLLLQQSLAKSFKTPSFSAQKMSSPPAAKLKCKLFKTAATGIRFTQHTVYFHSALQQLELLSTTKPKRCHFTVRFERTSSNRHYLLPQPPLVFSFHVSGFIENPETLLHGVCLKVQVLLQAGIINVIRC